jgi:hypothetical protein
LSWGDWFESIWDALVNSVLTLDEFTADNTFYGEKYPPNVFPAAFVCPSEAFSIPKTFRESVWNPQFEIGITVKDPDTKAGFITAFKLAGKVIDLLTAERTLGGIVHNLECSRVVPYWRGLGRGLESHWVGIFVRCERKL